MYFYASRLSAAVCSCVPPPRYRQQQQQQQLQTQQNTLETAVVSTLPPKPPPAPVTTVSSPIDSTTRQVKTFITSLFSFLHYFYCISTKCLFFVLMCIKYYLNPDLLSCLWQYSLICNYLIVTVNVWAKCFNPWDIRLTTEIA